jgi:hypothetical protein
LNYQKQRRKKSRKKTAKKKTQNKLFVRKEYYIMFSKFVQTKSLLRLLPIVVILLSLTLEANAAPRRLYKPRKGRAPRTAITTTATRGCPSDRDAQGKFVAIAPVLHPGYTISRHPTFAWYIPSQTARKLQFQLAKADSEFQEIIYQTTLDSRSGIMQLTLPKGEIALNIGQSYNWRVILQCTPGKPSEDQLIDGEIEVVTADPDLNKPPKHQTAQAYAEAGLWYDAFAATTDPATKNQLLQDLIETEQVTPEDRILQQSQALQFLLKP